MVGFTHGRDCIVILLLIRFIFSRTDVFSRSEENAHSKSVPQVGVYRDNSSILRTHNLMHNLHSSTSLSSIRVQANCFSCSRFDRSAVLVTTEILRASTAASPNTCIRP